VSGTTAPADTTYWQCPISGTSLPQH